MEDLVIKKLSFTERPISIPAEYRPLFKIALIVLILKLCCRGETAGLLKLHLFSWALSSQKNSNRLREYVDGGFASEFSVWGIEPALNRAIQFAIAENICDVVNGKNYKLTVRGNKLYEMLNDDKELLAQEKSLLAYIGKSSITDGRIASMTKQWSLPYA